MPAGNFAASLLMRPRSTPADAALRSFVAALALREAFIAAGWTPGGSPSNGPTTCF
jgi:BirA family biotin operon repressor/biotin-[acetyl-CoA-carboxylase] ligase